MLEGILIAIQPASLFSALAGVVIGIIFGAIPGLTATLAIALLVPVTFLMAADQGLIMLGGVYAGAIFGGSISAILLNIPGTPASIVTGWEGYALAKQGKAPLALGLAALSSGIGGLLSAIAMLFLTPVLAGIALKFGSAEYVALVVFSLVIVVVMLDTPIMRNIAGVMMGLALAAVGLDPINGVPRFTFGYPALSSGFNIVAVLIGFFCMTQALILASESLRKTTLAEVVFSWGSVYKEVFQSMITRWGTYLRASGVGIVLGILPAIGPESTPFMVHAMERRFANDRESFGKGSITGLIAAEASNSANVGGSLIPLLSLGIPGSGAAAMFLGALTLHGLRPGPLLFTEQPTVLYTFFMGFIFVNIFMMLLGLFGARYFAVVLRVPKSIVATFVALFSVFGTYAVNNTLFDVWIMFAATAFALLLRVIKIPILPVVLAMILSALFEENLAVMRSTFTTFESVLTRPIAGTLFGISAVIFLGSAWRRLRSRAAHAGTGSALRSE